MSLKILLACAGLLISLALIAACGTRMGSERPAVVDYLKAYDQIENDLVDTYIAIIDSIAG